MNEKPIIQINLKVIICKIIGHETYEAKCRGEFFGYDCARCGSRFMCWVGKPRYPDFKTIVMNCKKKIDEKFYQYGNSWVNFTDDEFWKKRLQGEINEIWKAKTPEQMKSEIVDAINVLTMIDYNVDEMTQLFDEKVTEKEISLENN